MGTPATSARIVRFGIFEVDLNALELRKNGLRLKLSEQPFQILAMLLERPGELITRDELRNRLWQTDTFVDFDHGLNNAVMRLREVLGDSSDNPRFVETIPRRGYRFIAHVEFKNSTSENQSPEVITVEKTVGVPDVSSKNGPNVAPGQHGRRFSISRIALLAAAVLVGSALISGITVHYVRGVDASKGKANRSSSLV